MGDILVGILSPTFAAVFGIAWPRDILSWTCNLEIDNWFPTPQTIVSKGDTKKAKKARKTHQHVRNCIGKERTRNQKETSGNVRNCRSQATVKRLNEKCQALEAAKPKVPCVPWKGYFWSPRTSEEYGKWESLGFLGGFMGIIVYLWKWWETTNMLTIIEGFQGTVWNDFWNLCWDIKRVSLFANNIWSLSKHEMKSSTKQVGFPTN